MTQERVVCKLPEGIDPRQQILGPSFFNNEVPLDPFSEGLVKSVEHLEQGGEGKTIEQIREENGLPSRIDQLRDAQEEWMSQGHG